MKTFSSVCALLIILQVANALPYPQFPFLQPPRINTNDPSTQLTGLATLGTTLFAGYNCLTGDCNLHIRPNLGLNYDPKTGGLAPSLGANVQVGDKGIVNPSFNLGGQFNPNAQGGVPVTPFVGTGVNVGDGNGNFNPALTSNFALANGDANPQIGGGLNLGNLNLGNPNNFFGRRRR